MCRHSRWLQVQTSTAPVPAHRRPPSCGSAPHRVLGARPVAYSRTWRRCGSKTLRGRHLPACRGYAHPRCVPTACSRRCRTSLGPRSEEHTSELQSLMRISYAVFCLKKKKIQTQQNTQQTNKKTKNIQL